MKSQNNLLSHMESWWNNLAEGWHELSHKAERAITKFAPHKGENAVPAPKGESVVGWSLMPLEIREEDREFVVELEVPGLEKSDLLIDVDDNCLRVSGEKYATSDRHQGSHHVVERAYGRFQRMVPLPGEVHGSDARATYKRGVLTVRLPKKVESEKTSSTIRIA